MNIRDVLDKSILTKDDLLFLMKVEKEEEIQEIYKKAYEIKKEFIGQKVYYRGLIEFSNFCVKNCLYCGIRKDNKNVERYDMSKEDILNSVRWIHANGYGSVALQSGERQDNQFIEFVTDIIKEIKKIGDLGITLSLGEQSEETYKQWFEAGAHRYLLRIETTNKNLYNKIHPNDELHDFDKRVKCLETLKKLGYQVGTGVMIGLPFQTYEDLINDILFYKDKDIDMIGMGPYIPHDETPMGSGDLEILTKEKRVELGLKMIALARIFLKDVNIAATTALQGLDPLGREKGLKAGANILMPITTKDEHRAKYQLYNGKPCIDDNADKCKNCLEGRIKSVGEEIIYNNWGDSPHFKEKNYFNY